MADSRTAHCDFANVAQYHQIASVHNFLKAFGIVPVEAVRLGDLKHTWGGIGPFDRRRVRSVAHCYGLRYELEKVRGYIVRLVDPFKSICE